MKICEIFYSIQGEGKNTGRSTVFIRFQGCNLRCRYCDTKYAQNPQGGKEMTLDEVIQEVRKYPCNRVCITGGEPLTQPEEFQELLKDLKRRAYYVEVETNGSIGVPYTLGEEENADCWTVDVKCPGAGESHRKFITGITLCLREQDQLKFVVSSEEDLAFVRDFIHAVPWLRCGFLISPCWAEIKFERIVEFIKKEVPTVRLSLQIHKIIWEPERRGV